MKISVKFHPVAYTYYYDCIRIRAENQNLVIPLHGYPVINNIEFPSNIQFGNSPLCEPATKVISII